MKISGSAVRQATAALGTRSAPEITLTAAEVTSLASRAGVEDDVIRRVAPQLENQGIWGRSLKGAKTVYQQTPEEVRSNLVGLACEGWRGEIATREDLYLAIAERLYGATQDEYIAFLDSVDGLWQDLYEAGQSNDPDRRAAAILACYTVENVIG